MVSGTTYEGKVKLVELMNDDSALITFTNKITAGNGAKKDELEGKGKINLDTTILLFEYLRQVGIHHHILSRQDDLSIKVKRLNIFKIEVVVRNYAAGSFAARYGIEQGKQLDHPVVEYFLKDDDLNDPVISPEVAVNLDLISDHDLSYVRVMALMANQILTQLFTKAGLNLIDFKLEFGTDSDGNIILGDELSGDCMRVWDTNTGTVFDKDRFRKDLGDVMEGYHELYQRLSDVKIDIKPIGLVAEIIIEPKKGITNPAGEVTRRAIVNSGLNPVTEVVTGKRLLVKIGNTSDLNWLKQLKQVCQDLLTNPLIEQYSIRYWMA